MSSVVDDVYDCVVIGAGVEGSSSAYQLARAGVKTLLLEQFSLLHTNGSSHGGSRITRRAYPTCEAALATDTFPEWDHIEKLSNTKFYVKTGLVYFGKKGSQEIEKITANLIKYDASHKLLDSKALRSAIPNSNYSDDFVGIYDYQAGVLLADKALSALQDCFRSLGGHVRENCEVTGIQPGHPIVVVETKERKFSCKNLVLCAGTWNGKLLSWLGLTVPLQPRLAFVYYWKEKIPGSHSPDQGMPTFIDCNDEVYALPSIEYPGYVKICSHGGWEYKVDDEASVADKPPFQQKEISAYIKEHFPELDSTTPSHVIKCRYTMTPDEMFVLDRHPNHSNIIVAAGFSGTGFKIGPVIGNIVKDLVLEQTPKYDLKPYSIHRFANK